MADEEQEWIAKYRAAMETAQPIKKSRLTAILAGLGSARRFVSSIMNHSRERAKTVLSVSMSEQPAKLEPAQAPATAVEQRHRSPSRSSKPISVERPASLVPQRRRAS